ncbi:NucA/NucB deoxyribonuclease domain-containing protein [Streptomyces sp. NPDC002057]|uniref:NucA/NucB deoxyribonuclease domain-containing protein n=1 Tax=Streptomyces sp. NPDC002057 TaxID=3154664 RepID=UPI00332E50FB
MKIGDRVPTEDLPWNQGEQAKDQTWKPLTEHGDVIAQRTGVTYKVNLDDYQEGVPAERETFDEWDPINRCRGVLNGAEGVRILNRYDYCSVKKFTFYWVVKSTGEVTGKTSFVQTTAGQAPADRREIYYMVNLGYFDFEGYYRDIPFAVVGESLGYSGSDGSNPACGVINSANNPTTLEQWRTRGAAVASIVFDQDKSKGYGRDFVSRCNISTTINPKDFKLRSAETPIRFDSAGYVGAIGSSGIFDGAIPTMVYDLASPSHGAVAAHIQTAFNDPASTAPSVPGKNIPGKSMERPLRRLYETWDKPAANQRNNNVRAKDKACLPIRPADTTGLDCDEFPFGSTWEGPAAGTNFSVRYLDWKQNRSAGGSLANFYARDRVIHWDRFIVEIVNSG